MCRFTCIIFFLFASTVLGQTSGETERKLLIHGGGGITDSVRSVFVELAGGENARLVVVPTATADEYLPTKAELNEVWGKFGIAKIAILHTRDPQEANSKEFLIPLKDATAIWFGGGDQRRLSRAYSNTAFEKEVCRLLKQGVVVGGTSAGAAIQSKVMIEGGRNVPAIGSGLNLLPSSIIDQHFLERSRLNRLTRAVELHPSRTGIGISERTALVVAGKQATVVGSGFVISIQIRDKKLDLRSWESESTFDLDRIGL